MDLVTSGGVNRDAEDAFFIDEPSYVAGPEPRRRLGLLPLVVSGFGLTCTFALAAVVAMGVMGRMDEVHQLQRDLAVATNAPPADIAPPPAAEPPAEPTALPDVAPPPEPVAPEPVAPEPAPAVAAAAVAAVAPEPAPDLPRVETLSVEAAGASQLKVKCGGVSRTGTESVELTDFPAGFCTVEVHQFDDTFRMGLGVEEAKTLSCGVEQGVLRCS